MDFLFTVESFSLILLCLKIGSKGSLSKYLSTDKNPQTRSCCQLEPVRVSGFSGTLNAVTYEGGKITPGARYNILQAGSVVGSSPD
jgi:hypothetical protein